MATKITQNPSNRRRVPRRKFDTSVGLLIKGTYIMARSFQVGEGGMMFSSKTKLASGDLVVVSFCLNLGSLIVVRGIIRSVIPADASKGYPERYGIEFQNLGFQFKREIRNFVAAATRVDGQLA